jgi:hypothetical protein
MQDKKKNGSQSSSQKKKTQSKASKPRPRKTRGSPSKSFQQRDPSRLKEPKMATRGATGQLVGEDLVATLGSSGTEIKAGDVLLDIQLNPELMALPRLTSLSKLFKRWRIRSMTFEYRPTATIQPGQLLGYIDYDPYTDAKAGTNLQRLQRATASYGEKPVNITNTKTWSVMKMPVALQIHSENVSNPTNWYVFGRFVIYANSNIAANVDCGNIVCKYDIEFLFPSYEIPPATANGIAPPGFFFEGDWNSTTQSYENTMFYSSSNDLKSHVSIDGADVTVQQLEHDQASIYNRMYMGFISVSAQSAAYYGAVSMTTGWTSIYYPDRGEYNSASSRGNQFVMMELSNQSNIIKFFPNKIDVGNFTVRVVFTQCCDFNYSPSLRSVPLESKEQKRSFDCERKSTTDLDLSKVQLHRSGTVAPPTTPSLTASSSTLTNATVSSGWFRV